MSVDRWIKKMWYICTMEYYSAIKNNEIMAFAASWTDLEMTILSEVKSDKDRYHMISLICGIFKKAIRMSLFTKQKKTHRHGKQTYGYQRGRREE